MILNYREIREKMIKFENSKSEIQKRKNKKRKKIL